MELFTDNRDEAQFQALMASKVLANEQPVLVCHPELLPLVDKAKLAFSNDKDQYDPAMVTSPAWEPACLKYSDFLFQRVLQYLQYPSTGLKDGRENEIWRGMERLNGDELELNQNEYINGGIPAMITLSFRNPKLFEKVIDAVGDLVNHAPLNQMWIQFQHTQAAEPPTPNPETVSVTMESPCASPAPVPQDEGGENAGEAGSPASAFRFQFQEANEDQDMGEAAEPGEETEAPGPDLYRWRDSTDNRSFLSFDSVDLMSITTPSMTDPNGEFDPELEMRLGEIAGAGLAADDEGGEYPLVAASPAIFFNYFRRLVSRPLLTIARRSKNDAGLVRDNLTHLLRFCTAVRMIFDVSNMTIQVINAHRHGIATNDLEPLNTGAVGEYVDELMKSVPEPYRTVDRHRAMCNLAWMRVINDWTVAAQFILLQISAKVDEVVNDTNRHWADKVDGLSALLGRSFPHLLAQDEDTSSTVSPGNVPGYAGSNFSDGLF